MNLTLLDSVLIVDAIFENIERIKKLNGMNKMTIKKQIEAKQKRLQRLVNQGRLTQTEANRQVIQFAKLACRILGDEMKELKQTKVKTPELKKILAVAKDSQRIGEFLEWLGEQGIILVGWGITECEDCGFESEGLILITKTREELLADYFKINLNKAEKERLTLLDAVRQDNS